MELLRLQKDIIMSDNSLTIVCAGRGAGTTTGLLERALSDIRLGKFVLFIGNKTEVCRYLEDKKDIRYSGVSSIFSFKHCKGKLKCLDTKDIFESGKIPDAGYDTVIVDRIDFLKNSQYSIKFFQEAIRYNRDFSLRENATDLLVSLSKDSTTFNPEKYPDAYIIETDMKDNPYLDNMFKNVLDVTVLKKKEEDVKRACKLVADIGDLMVDFLEDSNGSPEVVNKLKGSMDKIREDIL